jgi:hypothetical protein
MKKLFVVLTLIAFACVERDEVQQPTAAQAQHVGPAQVNDRSANGRVGTFYTYFNDWSNTVHTVVVEKDVTENAAGLTSLGVPSDYVLVGGGAYTSDAGAGGYIMSTYPSGYSTFNWNAQSHDHQTADTHTLTVYAVGLKIDGVTASTLESYMSRVSSPLPTQYVHAPTASVSLTAGYNLVGGGAVVTDLNGNGNFLIYSYPSSTTTWEVGSKDQNVNSFAGIVAYAIGIPSTIPGFSGQLEVSSASALVLPGYGYATASVTLPSGWAPTCVGAISTAYTNGRLLTGLRPPGAIYPTQFMSESKDCGVATGGWLSVFGICIRKKQ